MSCSGTSVRAHWFLEHFHLGLFVPESKGLSKTLLTSRNWIKSRQPTTCIAQPLYVASLCCCTSLKSVEVSTNPAQLNLSSAERASGASAKLRYHAKQKRALRPFLLGPQRPAITAWYSCYPDVHWYTFISICACHQWVRYSLQLFGVSNRCFLRLCGLPLLERIFSASNGFHFFCPTSPLKFISCLQFVFCFSTSAVFFLLPGFFPASKLCLFFTAFEHGCHVSKNNVS